MRSSTHVIWRAFLPRRPALPPPAAAGGGASTSDAAAATSEMHQLGFSILTTTGVPPPTTPLALASRPHHDGAIGTHARTH
uniref:Uncharacterized protein n=1 Tax=Zea mays TaxID=4577 RepID=A0A804Q4N9_MAIZE